MPITITTDILRKVAPRGCGEKAARQAAIIGQMPAAMEQAASTAIINTPLRMAHFLAQLAHESDGFCTLEEYASGAAYESRKDLGNTRPGDGRRFKGRGLIQLTGRANYTAFNEWCAATAAAYTRALPDFLKNPEILAQMPAALWSAHWYWQTHKLNQYADKDDIITITKKINGGLNGLDSRRAYLARAKAALGIVERSKAMWA